MVDVPGDPAVLYRTTNANEVKKHSGDKKVTCREKKNMANCSLLTASTPYGELAVLDHSQTLCIFESQMRLPQQ